MQGGNPPCIPDSHLYRVTNTRCRIGTVFSADDEHIVNRNMWRKAIKHIKKIVHQVRSTRTYKLIFGTLILITVDDERHNSLPYWCQSPETNPLPFSIALSSSNLDQHRLY